MKQQRKYFLYGLLAVALIVIFVYVFMIMNTALTANTYYSNVQFTPNSITYSNPISPDYNYLTNKHLFKQWNTGNVQNFNVFSSNLQFLQFYLQQGLNVNPADFTLLAGDGDCYSYGEHLQPAYCKQPTGSYSYSYIDADGCPHYVLKSRTNWCMCFGSDKTCGDLSGRNNPCAGASQCGWTDCSEYTVTNTDFGGTIDGVSRNYKAILQTDGWSFNYHTSNPTKRCTQEYSDWQKTNANDNTMNKITSNMSCIVSGTFSACNNNGVNCVDAGKYSIGSNDVTWESTSGFSCNINNLPATPFGYGDIKVNYDTSVIFSMSKLTSYYIFDNNTCQQVFLSTRPENSYSDLSSCNKNIVNPSCSDKVQNQDETGIDCGGVCKSCSVTSSLNVQLIAWLILILIIITIVIIFIIKRR